MTLLITYLQSPLPLQVGFRVYAQSLSVKEPGCRVPAFGFRIWGLTFGLRAGLRALPGPLTVVNSELWVMFVRMKDFAMGCMG